MLTNSPLIAFVPSTDLARSRAFYEGLLGLSVLLLDGFALTIQAPGGTKLRVTQVQAVPALGYTILGWEVKSVSETAQELCDRGVELARFPGLEQDALGIWTAPGGTRVAWFRDPDQNILSLSGG